MLFFVIAGNNIFSIVAITGAWRRGVTVRQTCIDIGRMVDQEGISVAILSLTARADDKELAKRVKEVNKILRNCCSQNEWGFI